MQLIRQFELKAEEMYKMAGKIRGFFHAYVGQEAIAAGCMTATTPDDPFATGYRDHGWALAKGVSPNACMAELYGKATGCSKGKGGSMHFLSVEHKFFGGQGIVCAQIATGAGLAFAEQYKGTNDVALCFFCDGAARQGILHETFNLAMLWKLPAVFICENNHYAMGTFVQRTSNVIDIYKLADSYDMPGDKVDGMNPEDVHEAVARAVKRAREGGGQTLLEMKTYRYKQIIIAAIAIIIVVGGLYGYNQYIVKPKEETAAEGIYKAKEYFAQDSSNLVLNGDGFNKGVLYIIKSFDVTKTADLAKYYAGISYLKLGDFANAVKYLKEFSTGAPEIQMAVYGALADAEAELGKNEDAIKDYKKAGATFPKDAFSSSEYLLRAGLLSETLAKPKDAIELYKEIKEKYPQTDKGLQADKYIYRLSIEKNDLIVN
jgi:pyruvate dehydrogenase E1 component alpha subunit